MDARVGNILSCTIWISIALKILHLSRIFTNILYSHCIFYIFLLSYILQSLLYPVQKSFQNEGYPA